MKKHLIRALGTLLVLGVLSYGGYYFYEHPLKKPLTYKTAEEADVYVRFDMEAFDSIVKNVWQKAEEKDFAQLFALAVQKSTSAVEVPKLETNDRAGVAKMLANEFNKVPTVEAKKQLATNILMVVLYNLSPVGRNALLSEKQNVELRQNVNNINPGKDLYKNLGLEKGADQKAVEEAFKIKEKVLAKATTTEAKKELEQVEYAKKVLTNENTKTLYDEAKIEPTIFTKIFGSTVYMYIEKISPTTMQEFANEIDRLDTNPKLSNLIVDFRGNVGGALDFSRFFLGMFVGPNQFAFDLFHQGDYQVQRTPTPKFTKLDRYKEIAFLTDKMSQSTAELTPAIFKRMKLAVIVGEKTRGWGSVENTYPIETSIDPGEKYTLLLVNSLTLRDDNQPIEGSGVEPNVDITKNTWRKDLNQYFKSAELIKNIQNIVTKPPAKN